MTELRRDIEGSYLDARGFWRSVKSRDPWDDAYDAGYYSGWVRGFLTALAVAVISLVLLVLL